MRKFRITLFLTFAVAILFGFGIRSQIAKNRAVHADEAEQAHTFLKLYNTGSYAYNPNGPHGPSLYYYSLAAEKLLDATGVMRPQACNIADGKSLAEETPNIASLRFGLFGIFAATLALVFLAAKFISAGTAACAVGVLCFSVLSAVYSGYYVHESIFAFAALGLFICAWGLLKKPSVAWAAGLGLFAGLAQSTKETAPILFASAALAIVPEIFLSLKENRNSQTSAGAQKYIKLLCVAVLCAAGVMAVLYTSFGSNPRGLCDAFLSYAHFAGKSCAPEHTKELLYYFKLLFAQKSGGIWFGECAITLLGIAGAAIAYFKRKDDDAKFILAAFVYFALNVIILTLIPYKMPWLLLSAATVLCIPAGYAVCTAFRTKNFLLKLALMAALALALFAQTKQLRLIAQRFHSDPRNPFVSVHTVSDFNRLQKRVADCAKISEYGADMPVCVYMSQSPWPMPWAFRNLKNAGFWTGDMPIPENLGIFEIVITDSAHQEEILKRLDSKKYKTSVYGLRENLLLYVFIKENLFSKLLEMQ